MSRTEPDAGTPCVEEVDGVPAYDLGGVLTDGRSRMSEPASLSPESTIGRLAAEGGPTRPYQLSVRTVLSLFLGISEGEWVDISKVELP